MKIIGFLLLRACLICAGVILLTAMVYAVNGGQTARGLSDWLVYASFFTLAIGTGVGVSNAGYKRITYLNGPPEGRIEHWVKEFFLAGPFGVSFALAGPLCFGAAVLLDLMFK